MKRAINLFDEVSAALQFPHYFGENWDALDECLSDLSWLPASRYVIGIAGAPDRLVEEQPAQLAIFVKLLVRASEIWSAPIQDEQPWDRPAAPFHWFMQVEPDIKNALM